MTTPEPTPRTAAGRSHWLSEFNVGVIDENDTDPLLDAILAIEREAHRKGFSEGLNIGLLSEKPQP